MKEELSIITEAREAINREVEIAKAKTRLSESITKYGKNKLLGGRFSARVLQTVVFGQKDENAFSIEIRALPDINPDFALRFSCGGFQRSYFFINSESFVSDTGLEEKRLKGAWIGSPDAILRRRLSHIDVIQLNEAMDLFEQNVGKGINRD